jgi:8-oxo-dGTP pyrophosphatase MutT (NUDIX family)
LAKHSQGIQFAALPYRVEDGKPLILMVTSRETKRWILPKGQPEKKLKPHEVARAEAYEEAGVSGSVGKKAFAGFASVKRLKNGTELPCQVKVYLLSVETVRDEWPEKGQRERRWFTPGEAATAVGEPGLVQILLDFGARWS